jgi:hypothetical protein
METSGFGNASEFWRSVLLEKRITSVDDLVAHPYFQDL